MVLTGTRLGEAGGLLWDCVDFEENEVRILRTLSWDHWTKEAYLVQGAKTEDSVRVIPMATTLANMLFEIKASNDLIYPVFHCGGGRFLSDNVVRKNFNRAFVALKLTWRATHICRHTHATNSLIANDGNLSAVQATLGHRDQKVTQKYAKVVAMKNRIFLERVAQLLTPGQP